jgi:hypothetical protein
MPCISLSSCGESNPDACAAKPKTRPLSRFHPACGISLIPGDKYQRNGLDENKKAAQTDGLFIIV